MGQTESVYDRLESIVKEYELFSKAITMKPSSFQLGANAQYEYNFKRVYGEALAGKTSDSKVEDLLTRFKKAQIHIHKLATPEVYNNEPLS